MQYNLPPDADLKMWEKQNKICPVCGDDLELEKAHIDHDHETGKVRGLLHPRCNSILGNNEQYEGAARYLARHNFDLREYCVNR